MALMLSSIFFSRLYTCWQYMSRLEGSRINLQLCGHLKPDVVAMCGGRRSVKSTFSDRRRAKMQNVLSYFQMFKSLGHDSVKTSPHQSKVVLLRLAFRFQAFYAFITANIETGNSIPFLPRTFFRSAPRGTCTWGGTTAAADAAAHRNARDV